MARTTLPKNHGYDFGPLIKKYLRILHAEDMAPPVVTIVKAKLGRCWLGLNTWYWSRPHTSLIEIDERITDHAPSLERIFAHEMVHHVEHVRIGMEYQPVFQSGNRMEIKRALSFMRAVGDHGRAFREGAALVNAVMGKDFVTVTSDQSYECAPSQKSFLMLIVPLNAQGSRLGFQWGIKPSSKALKFIQSKLMIEGEPSARLVLATGDHWASSGVGFAGRGWSVPTNPKHVQELRDLYERGQRMKIVQDDYSYKYSVVPMKTAGAIRGRTRQSCSMIAEYDRGLPTALANQRFSGRARPRA